MNKRFVRMTMMMTTMTAVVVLASPPASADAPTRVRRYPRNHTSRIFIGADLGFITQSSAVDATPLAIETGYYAGVHTGYGHHVFRNFGVIGLMRYGHWETVWSNGRGEERNRLDAALGLELRFGDRRAGWHIATLFGPTLTQIRGGDLGRLIQESYGPGRGANFALSGGYHVGGTYSSAYIDIAWLMHSTRIDQKTRQTTTGAIIDESLGYADHVIMFTGGCAFAL
jgi:hypothetical protein